MRVWQPPSRSSIFAAKHIVVVPRPSSRPTEANKETHRCRACMHWACTELSWRRVPVLPKARKPLAVLDDTYVTTSFDRATHALRILQSAHRMYADINLHLQSMRRAHDALLKKIPVKRWVVTPGGAMRANWCLRVPHDTGAVPDRSAGQPLALDPLALWRAHLPGNVRAEHRVCRRWRLPGLLGPTRCPRCRLAIPMWWRP